MPIKQLVVSKKVKGLTLKKDNPMELDFAGCIRKTMAKDGQLKEARSKSEAQLCSSRPAQTLRRCCSAVLVKDDETF